MITDQTGFEIWNSKEKPPVISQGSLKRATITFPLLLYLFIGCAGSLLLPVGFLQLQRAGAFL